MRPWLKRGAGVFSRALLLYNHLNFTDYEEGLLLRDRHNSAWKCSAVTAFAYFRKYDNSYSAWSMLGTCACVVLYKYDNWQAFHTLVVQKYDNHGADSAWKSLSLIAILPCRIVR